MKTHLARERVAAAVIEAVSAIDPRVSIGFGSWVSGDFHLCLHPLMSYSDVDATATPEIEAKELPALQQAIAETVDALVGLRLSITFPPREWASVEPPAARFLAIGEFLRKI